MNRENRFAAILQARKEPAGEQGRGAAPAQVLEAPRPTAPVSPTPVAAPAPSPIPATPSGTDAAEQMPRPTNRAGRGKSSDPRFKQVTAYIPQDLHTNATIALRLANEVRIDAEKQDFSELLTTLLAKWYQTQSFYRPEG